MKILLFAGLLLLCCGLTKPTKKSGCLKVDIMLLVDMSGSVSGHEKFIKDASNAFVDKFELSEEGIKIGFIRFSSKAYILSALTTNKTELQKAVQTIETNSADGSTDMEGAIVLATEEIMKHGREGFNKIVVIISDGDPDSKDKTRRSATLLKMINGTICGIYIDVDSDYSSNKKFMSEISSEFCYAESNYENLLTELEKLNICM